MGKSGAPVLAVGSDEHAGEEGSQTMICPAAVRPMTSGWRSAEACQNRVIDLFMISGAALCDL